MYSVVVVQEVLQRKWESWRWGVQLPAIWEDHQSWSSYNYTRSAKELSIHHSIVIQHLKQIGKVRKLDKWMPHAAAAAAKSLQSCPTLCDPIDGSPPGSPVPGILQARTLEWVAISFSGCHMSWPQMKKNIILKCHPLLFYTTTMNHF